MYDPAFDPIERLAERRVRIVNRSLNNHDAIWLPRHNVVVLDTNIDPAMKRPVLTHEWVHVINNDPGGHHPRNEARANLISAMVLTDPDRWADLTPIYDDYDHICLEIGITRGQFMAYYQHHTRRAA